MQLGRYTVIGELGRGGMGSVALAKNPQGQLVVLKTPLDTDRDLCERLRDEARVGLRLSHPNLVETLDLFEHDGRPVLVIEYVEGVSLHELRQKGALPLPVVCRIGRQISDALDSLHHAADEHHQPLCILHRDVTPANILVGYDGDARLIDLGIARSTENQAARTRTGFMRGTLRYLAPELFDNQGYTAASDLWSLGIVLLEAALGRRRFSGTDSEVVGQIVSGRALRFARDEKLDPRFLEVVRPLLAQRPGQRPARGLDVASQFAELEEILGDATRLAANAVHRVAGPPRYTDLAADDASARQLMGLAAASFCGDLSSSSDDDLWAAKPPQTRDAMSERPAVAPASETPPPQLEVTGYHAAFATGGHGEAAMSTPSQELLAYARKLREFEQAARPLPGPALPPVAVVPEGSLQATPIRARASSDLPVLEPMHRAPPLLPDSTPPGAFIAPARGGLASAQEVATSNGLEQIPRSPPATPAAHGVPKDARSSVRRLMIGLLVGLGAVMALSGLWGTERPSQADGLTSSWREGSRAALTAHRSDVRATVPATVDVAPEASMPGGSNPDRLDPATNIPSTSPPPCATETRTKALAYRDQQGRWHTVKRWAEVPERFQWEVRCLD